MKKDKGIKKGIRILPFLSLTIYCLLGWWVLSYLPDSGWTYRFLKMGFVFSLLAGTVSAHWWRFYKRGSFSEISRILSRRQQFGAGGALISLVLLFVEYIHPSPATGVSSLLFSGFNDALSSSYLSAFFASAIVSLLFSIVLRYLLNRSTTDSDSRQIWLTGAMAIAFALVFLPLVFTTGLLSSLVIALVPTALLRLFDFSKWSRLQSLSLSGGIGAVVTLIGLRLSLYFRVSAGSSIVVLFLLILFIFRSLYSQRADCIEEKTVRELEVS